MLTSFNNSKAFQQLALEKQQVLENLLLLFHENPESFDDTKIFELYTLFKENVLRYVDFGKIIKGQSLLELITEMAIKHEPILEFLYPALIHIKPSLWTNEGSTPLWYVTLSACRKNKSAQAILFALEHQISSTGWTSKQKTGYFLNRSPLWLLSASMTQSLLPLLYSVMEEAPTEAWNEPAMEGHSKGKTPLWNVVKSAAMPVETNSFYRLIQRTMCRGLNFDVQINGTTLLDRLFGINREILAMIIILRPDISSDGVNKETADFINGIKDFHGEIIKSVFTDVEVYGGFTIEGRAIYLAYMEDILRECVQEIPLSLYQSVIEESYKNICRLLDDSSEDAEEGDSLDCTKELEKLTLSSSSHKQHLHRKRK